MTDNYLIPKVIHYCWFGGAEKSELIKKCIHTWKQMCPDYEIVEWNENNFDINICPYVQEAYQEKKWAFVSDYARLWIVYNEGGIYLDTDVELLKSLNGVLGYKTFFASEDDHNINTGIGFGSVAQSHVIKALMDDYESIHFIRDIDRSCDMLPCTTRNTESFERKFGSTQNYLNRLSENGIMIFSQEYFCPFNNVTGEMNITDKTIAIHWFSASWRSKYINRREKIMRPIKKLIKNIKSYFTA